MKQKKSARPEVNFLSLKERRHSSSNSAKGRGFYLNLFILISFFACCFPTNLQAQHQLHGVRFLPDSRISIQVSGYFSDLPKYGYAPYRVSIQNNSSSKRTWTFSNSFSHSWGGNESFKSTFTYSVDAGDSKEFEMLIPLQISNLNSRSGLHRNLILKIKVSGYGVDDGQYNQSSSGQELNPSFQGLSEKIFNQFAPFEEAKKSLGSSLSSEMLGASFKPSFLPESWKAYTGFSELWFLDSEWEVLSPRVSQAIKDWVAMGGRVNLLQKDSQKNLLSGEQTIPGYRVGQSVFRHGFGRWTLRKGGIEFSDSTERLVKSIRNNEKGIPSWVVDGYRSWGLSKNIKGIEFQIGFFVILMILYSLLVSPINFMLFCRRDKKLRLLWTTPAIAVTTSLILVVIILLIDGVGGEGSRYKYIHIIPEEHQAIHLQEQVSKTGAMLSTSFALSPEIDLHQVNIKHSLEGAIYGKHFQRNSQDLSGDWFSARAIQAQVLREMQSTRWRIEKISEAKDESLKLISSMDIAVDDIFTIDKNKQWWRGKNLLSGQKQTLLKSSRAEMEDFLKQHKKNCGPLIANSLSQLIRKKGFFIAFSSSSTHYTETLDLDWKNQGILITGKIVERSR